jgi:hypothetical protein
MVLKAFTTRARGTFFCSCSAPLVSKPTARLICGPSAFVTSISGLPARVSPAALMASSMAP